MADTWSRKKKDPAPRGVFLHASSTAASRVWAIRFACGQGHIHEERAGLKEDAKRRHAARRQRVYDDPAWCPALERREVRERVRAEQERAARRVTFRQYAEDYLTWSGTIHRAHKTAKYEVGRLVKLLGDTLLDAITPAEVESIVRTLGETLAPASVNRLRDRLSGMLKRARRLRLVTGNPVTDIPKLKEAGSRLAYLTAAGETALLTALPPEYRPLVLLAANTGLRWSEQARLRWADVDLLAGFLTVCLAKSGHSRRVPLNSTARESLAGLAGRRTRPDDPQEHVSWPAYRTASRAFVRAVQAAQGSLRAAGQAEEASRLDGVTWHALRHTFASRLVTAGVDLRTVQELGGWRTLSMVQRYAHLSPGHLLAAVERIAATPAPAAPGKEQLGRNLDAAVCGVQS